MRIYNYNHESHTLESLGIDTPTWIDDCRVDEPADVAAILEGGCASGACMPAVTYHTALEIMSDHGDSVVDYIVDTYGELPPPSNEESWSGIAVHFLSTAVELWCAEAEGDIVAAMEEAEEGD